jgi:hypothetical protein
VDSLDEARFEVFDKIMIYIYSTAEKVDIDTRNTEKKIKKYKFFKNDFYMERASGCHIIGT